MENKVSMRLKDRPEFYNKPKPITFLKTDKVHKAISVMAEKNYGSVENLHYFENNFRSE